MPAIKVLCPMCRTGLKVFRVLPAKVRCPHCGSKSIITAEYAAAAGKPALPSLTLHSSPAPFDFTTNPAEPAPAASEAELAPSLRFNAGAPEYEPLAEPGSNKLVVVGLGLVGFLLLMACGVVAASVYFLSAAPPEPLARSDATTTRPPKTRPKPVEQVEIEPNPPAPAPLPPDPPPIQPRQPLPPEFVPVPDPNAPPRRPDRPYPDQFAQEMFGRVSPELQAKIDQAIEKGVLYLKNDNKELAELKTRKGGRAGYIALAGLTLLECGVPADDELVKNLVESVRTAEPNIHDTYSAAVAILFLDRHGDPKDRGLIRGLAARLIAGQNARGGWTYSIPLLNGSQRENLLAVVDRLPQPKLSATEKRKDGQAAPSEGQDPPQRPTPDEELKPLAPDEIPAAFRNFPVVKYKLGDKVNPRSNDIDDNSNTQFAILALWVARRHEVPVARTLALVDARFRGTQAEGGTWSYQLAGGNWKDSGTCAGLIGLGACRGIGLGPEAGAKADADPAIEKAIAYLGERLQVLGKKPEPGKPLPRKGSGKTVGADAHGDLYFLWSLERVSVAYHLKAYSDQEWYPWGAEILVNAQAENGSWKDIFPGIPDTCFALLFLKKANIAKDLTTELKKIKLPLTIRPETPQGD